MTLKAVILTDPSTVFLNTSDFAETVTYYPHTYFGDTARASRTISAVVIRRQAEEILDDDRGVRVPIFEVHVANDATVGISSSELDLGGDQIGFPPRDGEAAEKRTISQLESHDPGMLVLECR